MLLFKFYRRQVAIVRMESLSVVEDFDGVEDGFSGRFTGGIVFMVHAFGFQGVKKALGNGVIPAVAFTAHALLDAVLLKQFSVAVGGVLTAPVGVPQQAFFRFSLPDCHE